MYSLSQSKQHPFTNDIPLCKMIEYGVHKNLLLLHLRPNYIHSASNDIHTDGPRARARAMARARYSENLLIQHIS